MKDPIYVIELMLNNCLCKNCYCLIIKEQMEGSCTKIDRTVLFKRHCEYFVTLWEGQCNLNWRYLWDDTDRENKLFSFILSQCQIVQQNSHMA